MRTLLKILGLLAAGVVALVALFAVLGVVSRLLSWAFWIAVVAGIGWVVLKLVSAATGAPPVREEEAKTEESRPLSAPERKALGDAEARQMFEEERRKRTEGPGGSGATGG